MDTKILKEYAKLDAEYKALDERRTALRQEVVAAMKKSKIEKSETAFGTFTVGRRTVWKYSEVIEKMLEKVKIAKTKEEQKGIADSSVTEYLVFTTND